MSFSIPDRWAALAAQYPEGTVGRITLQEKGMYRIRTSMSEQNALVSGKFQFDAQSPSDYPAVGDYVLANCTDPYTVIIHQELPRRSLFVRKAAGTSKTEQVVAANIDTVFLCMSLNNDFNLRRLERYLSVAWESGSGGGADKSGSVHGPAPKAKRSGSHRDGRGYSHYLRHGVGRIPADHALHHTG